MGNVWGNAMVLLVLGPLGWVWAKTKFWPLRPIHSALHGLHRKADETHCKLEEHAVLHAEHAESLNALHGKLDRLLDDKLKKPKRSGKAVE